MREKRQFPRIEKILPITLVGESFTVEAKTKDISASGTYCTVSRPIPEFSKLAITLNLPENKGIRCQGVVVRAGEIQRENGGPSIHFAAIYFTDIQSQDRKRIEQYVARHLNQKGTP